MSRQIPNLCHIKVYSIVIFSSDGLMIFTTMGLFYEGVQFLAIISIGIDFSIGIHKLWLLYNQSLSSIISPSIWNILPIFKMMSEIIDQLVN